ncbi:hypothetical protein ABZX83_14670 [Streptomyces thermoviolaceus]|uniref:hypothetical protein n=1 Tax=Streptomyces thermoviolaceus TaxID=1952 RepID=UPI0033B9E7F5
MTGAAALGARRVRARVVDSIAIATAGQLPAGMQANVDALVRETHRVLRSAFDRFEGVDPAGRDVLDLSELGVKSLRGGTTQRPGGLDVTDIRQPWLRQILVTWIAETKPNTTEARRGLRVCNAASRALDLRPGGGMDPSALVFADMNAVVDTFRVLPKLDGGAMSSKQRGALLSFFFKILDYNRAAGHLDGMSASFARHSSHVIKAEEVDEDDVGKALPESVIAQLGPAVLLAGLTQDVAFSFTDTGVLELDPAMNDRGLGRSVLLAFTAGLAACDRVLVHSSTAASWTTAAAARTGVDLGDKLHIVPAPRDVRLVRDPADITPPEGRATGIYNHRLYRHYGTARFTRLARRLVADAPVRLTVMDLFGTRSPERIRLDPSPERHLEELATTDGVTIASDRGDRIRYRNLLAGAHFGIAPFRPGCPWSMSVIDCQAMGLPVIGPRTGWLAEHIDHELLFDTDEQAVQIAQRLATDAEFYLVQAKRAYASTADLTPAAVAARYLEAIK